MTMSQLWFTGPHRVEVRKQPLPVPGPAQVLVASSCSAISTGTEMLVYRGQLPADIPLDATLDSLRGQTGYPLQYGYACTGTVIKTGTDADPSWLGKRVFAFQPHASHFLAEPHQLLSIPDAVDIEDAVFLANMETAVNLVHDAAPLLGERAVVLGQGVVGLLLTGLLGCFPLAQLHCLDSIAERRERAAAMGATHTHDPRSAQALRALHKQLTAQPCAGADLVFEVSGAPEALNLALELCGFSGRVIIGSWYGDKTAEIALGRTAHRNRVRLINSQVSTIDPALGGRWDKARRFDAAWDGIRRLKPQKLITHRVPLEQADTIYKLLHTTPGQAMQAVFVYDTKEA